MPTSRPKTSRRRFVQHGLLLTLSGGCGSSPERATAQVPTVELPVYDQQAAKIFDDSIAAEVFGLQVDRPDPATDSLLRERSREADHVLRVKLRTIREERFDDSLRYRIVVETIGRPLVGQAVDGDLELSVGRASPSLSMLRSMSVEAVGAKFILLLKRYQLNDEAVFHFRGEPDQETILKAIRLANTPEP